IVVLFGGLVLLLWQDSMRQASGVRTPHVARKPVIATKPGSLGIVVAGLVDDAGGTYATLLRDTLAGAGDVELSPIGPPATLVKSKAEVLDVLGRAGADVLIWGQVDRTNGSRAMQLYWTDAS